MRFAAFLSILLLLHASTVPASADEIRVAADTRVYVVLEEEVVGKKKLTQEGKRIRAKVWRDVILDGVIVIESGTGVLVRVDELKKAKIAGRRGQLTLGAYETTATDGSVIQLAGGYNKKGKGRVALSASLAGLVFLPLIFLKGKAARLPEGTVFDAYTGLDFSIAVDSSAAPRSLDLSGVLSDVSVQVLYDELEKQEKPKQLEFLVSVSEGSSGDCSIDRINEAATDPIRLDVLSRKTEEGALVLHSAVDLKTLAKRFTKGINRFDIACLVEGQRVAAEVVLDIQF